MNTTISPEALCSLEQKFDQNPVHTVAMNAVYTNGINACARNYPVDREITHDYSISLTQGKITNQKKSGRCWMFAALNCLRFALMKKCNLETFELSQSYTLFYDKLEKSNYFLESILNTLDEKTSSRLIAHLLSSPLGDGGQWDMLCSLVNKYGLVPKSAMPESYSSSATSEMCSYMTEKLREFACILRRAHKDGESMEQLRARKEEMRRFAEHETNVVVATDAIGMGINMPIHRVVFLKTEKYDGTGVRDLTSPEIKQIAGRAGRRGIFHEGYVSTASKSKMVRKRLEEPYEDLEYAGVQIPDSLFALPMKLSDILAEWMKLKDRGIYRKASNEYRLQMCKWLEKNYPDFSKEAMWGFLCISYDEKNMFLQEEWKNIIGKISRKERIDTGFVQKSISNSGLNECEQYYKYLDLYFSFARTLGYVYEDFRHRLMKEKELTATRIMEKLKQSKRINQKTCRRCGKPLPFLYPYGYCQRCHDEEYYEWY